MASPYDSISKYRSDNFPFRYPQKMKKINNKKNSIFCEWIRDTNVCCAPETATKILHSINSPPHPSFLRRFFLWGGFLVLEDETEKTSGASRNSSSFPFVCPTSNSPSKRGSQQSYFLSSEDANKALRSTLGGGGVDFIFWGLSEWHGGQNTTCQNCRFEHSSHRRHVLESQITTKIIPILLSLPKCISLSLQIFKVGGNFENGPKNRRRHLFFSLERRSLIYSSDSEMRWRRRCLDRKFFFNHLFFCETRVGGRREKKRKSAKFNASRIFPFRQVMIRHKARLQKFARLWTRLSAIFWPGYFICFKSVSLPVWLPNNSFSFSPYQWKKTQK